MSAYIKEANIIMTAEVEKLINGLLEPNPDYRFSAEEALRQPWF
jgi:hypothetical protein